MERLLRYFHLFICLIWLLIVDQNAIWAERPQSLNFISKSQFTMWPKKPPGAQEPFLNRWPTPNKIPPTIIQTAASLSSAASSWVASCVASNSCSFPKKQRFLFEAKIHKAKHCDIKWHGLPRRMDISGDFDIFSQSCWKSACFASCACGTASSASASPHRGCAGWTKQHVFGWFFDIFCPTECLGKVAENWSRKKSGSGMPNFDQEQPTSVCNGVCRCWCTYAVKCHGKGRIQSYRVLIEANSSWSKLDPLEMNSVLSVWKLWRLRHSFLHVHSDAPEVQSRSACFWHHTKRNAFSKTVQTIVKLWLLSVDASDLRPLICDSTMDWCFLRAGCKFHHCRCPVQRPDIAPSYPCREGQVVKLNELCPP